MIVKQDKEKPIVAAFDFDGTLTTRDSLLPFLIFVRGKIRSTFYLTLSLPYLLGFICKIISRQSAKEALLKRFFYGEHIKTLQEWGEEFARLGLPRLLKQEAMERFLWHKAQNHRCIIVSASIDIYLDPWARLVGFQDVLCSKLALEKDNTVTGKLSCANCWGEEKVRRIEELLGPKSGYTLYAYGDSRGDREMLSIAEFAHKNSF